MKHLMFSLLLVFIVVGLSNAQMATGVADLTISGMATGLAITATEGVAVSGVVANTTYSVYYNVDDAASAIFPIIGGEEAADDLGFEILCDPYADVALSFVLPTKLLGTFTTLPINFTQLVRVEDLSIHNPNVPVVLNGGADGGIIVFFNYNFTVPKIIEEDGWTGTVVAVASYQ